MNARVPNITVTASADLHAEAGMNRVPIKVDAVGKVWMGGKPLLCPPVFTCSSRGELVFTASDTGLLLGPWGPDPDTHLTFSGRISGIDDEYVTVTLEAGLLLQTSRSVEISMPLKLRQRVWLSVSLSALRYCH